ncbi:MAG: hypothetical protein IPK64_19715 [bacterium]|nr:hypothetical protein [bacterium]
MTPDELDKIDSESALVALCVGPDEPPWDRSEDVATTALRWLAEHAKSPALLFSSARGTGAVRCHATATASAAHTCDVTP